jgi:heme/copper-type cytochrome/quinol oxidase subunit 4
MSNATSNVSHEDAENVKRHVRQHIMIAIALAIGTLTTLWTSQTHFGPFAVNVIITLGIASIQGFLVAAFYMHLLSEKKVIYSFLIFTAIFFVVMMGVTFFAHMPSNRIHIPTN